MPAIVDLEGPGGKPFAIFESGAILMYLAEKFGKLMPTETRGRYEVIEWLMFQMASVGPMLGQAHYFRLYAPEKLQYAIDRYTNEARRIYNVIDKRVGEAAYLAGEYSIADVAVYPWLVPHNLQGQNLDETPNLKRWYEEMRNRPAVQRGLRSWPMKSRRCARPPRLANGRPIRSRGTICSATGSSKRDRAGAKVRAHRPSTHHQNLHRSFRLWRQRNH